MTDTQHVTVVAFENSSDPLDGGWFLVQEPDGPLVVEYLIPPEGDQQPWMPVSVWSVPLPADVYAKYAECVDAPTPEARAKGAHANVVVRARELARLGQSYGWGTFDPHPQNLSVEEVCQRYGADSVLEAVEKDGADALSLDDYDDYEKAVRFVYAALALARGKFSLANVVNAACARMRATDRYAKPADKIATLMAHELAKGFNEGGPAPKELAGYSVLVLDAAGETAAWASQGQEGDWYVAADPPETR